MSDSDVTQVNATADKASVTASEITAVTQPAVEKAVKASPEPAPVAKAIDIPSVKPTAIENKAAVAKPMPVSSKVLPKAKVASPKKVLPPKASVKAVSRTPIAPERANKPVSSAKAVNKDETMTISKKVTSGFESIMTDAQAKAKEAFEKSTVMFGDYADFSKGNIEAVVESGKILASGLQGMGTTFVAESRSAFETASTDIKGLAAAKSPTDFFKLQSEMMRKSFDSAVAYGSKNTEAMIKLATEVMNPLSGRVTLAVEKVRQAAS